MTAELRMLALLAWVESGCRGDPPMEAADLGLALAVAQEGRLVAGGLADAGMTVAPDGYAFAADKLAPVAAILDAPSVRRVFDAKAASARCTASSQETAREALARTQPGRAGPCRDG